MTRTGLEHIILQLVVVLLCGRSRDDGRVVARSGERCGCDEGFGCDEDWIVTSHFVMRRGGVITRGLVVTLAEFLS